MEVLTKEFLKSHERAYISQCLKLQTLGNKKSLRKHCYAFSEPGPQGWARTHLFFQMEIEFDVGYLGIEYET